MLSYSWVRAKTCFITLTLTILSSLFLPKVALFKNRNYETFSSEFVVKNFVNERATMRNQAEGNRDFKCNAEITHLVACSYASGFLLSQLISVDGNAQELT